MYSGDEYAPDDWFDNAPDEEFFDTFDAARRYAARHGWCVEPTMGGYRATPYESDRTIWQPDED